MDRKADRPVYFAILAGIAGLTLIMIAVGMWLDKEEPLVERAGTSTPVTWGPVTWGTAVAQNLSRPTPIPTPISGHAKAMKDWERAVLPAIKKLESEVGLKFECLFKGDSGVIDLMAFCGANDDDMMLGMVTTLMHDGTWSHITKGLVELEDIIVLEQCVDEDGEEQVCDKRVVDEEEAALAFLELAALFVPYQGKSIQR